MLEIVYEDNHLLVAVKPANMLSQADDTGDADMLTVLKQYLKAKYQKPGNVYLGLVHRLDRPVGGLMVFARTSKAASRLSRQLQEHEMGRSYLCVAEGQPKDSFTLVNYVKWSDPLNQMRIAEGVDPAAKEAVLHGKTISRMGDTALCAITLETGRKHQIRVQMAAAGTPLWGDARYGRGIAGQAIALYGYRLIIEHPVTRQIMTFIRMPFGSIWTQYEEMLHTIARQEGATP